jgi:hypothetical protein
MKPGKMMAAIAVMGLVAPSAMAAVRPSVATISAAPVTAGARVGATSSAKRSNLTSTGTILAVAGVAAVGVGIAAAAGAFDSKHHHTVSP